MNPISFLKEIVTDPIELAGVTLPSAALVAGAFAYREQIHADLRLLPDPTKGNVLGVVIFVVVTLTVSIIIKQLSHDVLNWLYDNLARPRKLRSGHADTWFDRANKAGLLTQDYKRSKYEDALRQLRKIHHAVLPQITLLQVQSKLARSMTLVLIVFAGLFGLYNWILAVCLIFAAGFMWKIFCDFRWQASEAAYGALYDACSKTQP